MRFTLSVLMLLAVAAPIEAQLIPRPPRLSACLARDSA